MEAGTPGEANASCALDTEGAGSDARYGEVLITEFMADPAGVPDELGEWVELTNIGAEAVDVSGWQLIDDGRNAYTFPDALTMEPGATLVVAREADSALNGGLTADLATGEAFTLNNDLLYLTGTTEGSREIFQEMVAQGTSGSGSEMGLEAVRLATAPDMLAGHNSGFIREDANFNILVVSDEEDGSPDPVDTYLSAFASLKGDAAFRDHSIMNVSAVVGSDPPEFAGEASCVSANGAASSEVCQRLEMACTRLLDSLGRMALPSMRAFEGSFGKCKGAFEVRGPAATAALGSSQFVGVPLPVLS